MADVYHGIGASIGFGEESTWGTAVARSNWLRLVSVNMQRDRPKNDRPNLGDTGKLARRNFYAPHDNAGGTFETEMHYQGMGFLLKHAFGSVATTGVGPYVHTYNLGALGGLGLTMEVINSGDSGNVAEVFEGCKINRPEFSIRVGEVGMFRGEIIAETSGGLTSAGTPSYNTDSPVIHHQAGTLGFNSVNYDLLEMTVSWDRQLSRRQYLGSLTTKEPTASDFVTANVRAVVHFDSTSEAINAALLADTQGDVTMTFTGSGNNAMTWTARNAVITSASRPVNGPGPIDITIEFKCYADGTDDALTLAVTNDDATYST